MGASIGTQRILGGHKRRKRGKLTGMEKSGSQLAQTEGCGGTDSAGMKGIVNGGKAIGNGEPRVMDCSL
jgi:hypothetical protein